MWNFSKCAVAWVYEKTAQKIGALIQGEPVYVRVDAFNENGIARGTVVKLV